MGSRECWPTCSSLEMGFVLAKYETGSRGRTIAGLVLPEINLIRTRFCGIEIGLEFVDEGSESTAPESWENLG